MTRKHGPGWELWDGDRNIPARRKIFRGSVLSAGVRDSVS
jgi:hypothetical protein